MKSNYRGFAKLGRNFDETPKKPYNRGVGKNYKKNKA